MQRTMIYLVIFTVVFFYSCGRRPRYVLPEDKMTDVLYDIQLAEAIYRSDANFNTDEKKDALIAGVLAKYKISQADLDSSLLWYSDNIEYYMAVNDSVASRLRANNTLAVNDKSALTQDRGFADLLIPPYYNLTNATPTLSFNIDSSKLLTIDYPNFKLKFNVQGLSPLLNAEAAVFFTYKDTLVKDIIPIDKNTGYVFTKPQVADSLLKSITGYVHVSNKVRGLPVNIILYDIVYTDTLSVNNNDAESSESVRKIDPAPGKRSTTPAPEEFKSSDNSQPKRKQLELSRE